MSLDDQITEHEKNIRKVKAVKDQSYFGLGLFLGILIILLGQLFSTDPQDPGSPVLIKSDFYMLLIILPIIFVIAVVFVRSNKKVSKLKLEKKALKTKLSGNQQNPQPE
ncbi:MAG TPA: hypothetical protein VKK79_05935 [Candidatus Lokiarchaeia archaeon]|nr:hypothetical protein [Candidatus Lokiarchaeia archaeon]